MTLVEISKLEEDGYTDHIGDTKFAGMVARDIYTNWDDDAWRNAFILALGDYCENQILAHREELESTIKDVHARTVEKTRRAVVKSYLVSKASVRVDDYTRRDGTHVSGYSQHRPGAARKEPVGEDHTAALAAMLAGYNSRVAPNRQAGEQTIAYHISGDEGDRVAIHRSGDTPHIGPGERVTHIQGLGITSPTLSGHHAYNLAQALGANAAQSGSAGAVVQGVADVHKDENWFKRLSSASKALHYATGGGAGPVGVQVATAMGQAVGEHGPEVSRVLGPGIRRYSYKYRGMTAAPEQFNETARVGRMAGSDGKKETVEAFERKLLGNLASTDKSKAGLAAVPTDAQNALMLQSGSTAPSQGFILDSKGKAVQQAVGHADDHYVPFNLNRLHSLKNGSYVRSRAYGGPTTEDMSLALRTGASRVSTVSRHGIYTIQFDPRANTKRWGYTPRQVTNRYGRLLDAIKNGKVKDPNNPSETLKLDARGYEIALQSLKHQYPFLIAGVYHTPAGDVPELEGRRAGQGEYDTGYVRPMYLKPSEAKSGYHDPLLGGAKSFDDLEGYRSLKATRLRLQRDLERQAAVQRPVYGATPAPGSVAPGMGVRPGTPAREVAIAQAAGTDTGQVQRSYAMRDVEWDERQQAEMMKNVEDLVRGYIDMHQTEGEFSGKVEAGQLAAKFAGVRKGDREAMDWYERVRTNTGGAREDLLADLDELYSDYEGDNSGLITKLERVQDGLHENIGEREEEEQEFYQPFSDKAGNESPSSVEKDPEHDDGMFHAKVQMWKKNENLGEDKRRKMQEWYSKPAKEYPDYDPDAPHAYAPDAPKSDFWDDPEQNLTYAFHPDDESLPPWQQMVNRKERANGRNPLFVPDEDAEPSRSEIDSGVTDDMDDDEKDRRAAAWTERMMGRDPDDPYNDRY